MPTETLTKTAANPSDAKPQRPRLKRDPAIEVILQPRDYEILTLFLSVRLITTAELRALFRDQFEQPFTLWRRLFRLYHSGYLVRPPEQRWLQRLNPKPRGGNTEHIYALGNKGAQALARLGFPLPKIDWDQKAKALKPYSLEHPLLISRFLSCFTMAMKQAAGLELLELFPEGKFSEEVTFFDGDDTITLSVKPDALLMVEDRRNDQREKLALFFEADRSTMPLMRSTFKQSSFYKKILAYHHYWLQKNLFQERLGVDDFIVLTVCENTSRTLALRELAKEADTEKRGTDIFWFASKDALSLENPQTLLFGDSWTTAAGERGSIF